MKQNINSVIWVFLFSLSSHYSVGQGQNQPPSEKHDQQLQAKPIQDSVTGKQDVSCVGDSIVNSLGAEKATTAEDYNSGKGRSNLKGEEKVSRMSTSKEKELPDVLIFLLGVLSTSAVFVVYSKMKLKRKKTITHSPEGNKKSGKTERNTFVPANGSLIRNDGAVKTEIEKSKSSFVIAKEPDKNKDEEKTQAEKLAFDVVANPKTAAIDTDDWLIVGSSVMGKSHKVNNIPCQDSFFIEKINDTWGIAVCCDGAGSASNSHIGSSFVAKEAASIFHAMVKKYDFPSKGLPESDEWKELSKAGLYQVRQNLKEFADKNSYKLESLACTVIVVVYSPTGLLVTHIGDGRAAYLNSNKEWKPLIEPWKGEEANQTIFITSGIWSKQIDSFVRSNVIKEPHFAFTIMSDGCESHSFECSVINKETNQWSDPNRPFEKFFNPLRETMIQFRKQGKSSGEICEKWTGFLEKGNPGLKEEPDDKTMILGVFVKNSEESETE